MNTEILAKAADTELEDWGTLAEATGDPMATHGLEMWVDGEKSAGIWQCTPGPSYWVQDENEVIYVLSGRMTVTPDGGKPGMPWNLPFCSSDGRQAMSNRVYGWSGSA